MAERTKPDTFDPIPEQYAKGQWQPMAYTTEEGGSWNQITGPMPKNYSAIRYSNGWIYDNVLRQMNVNPWRHADDN